MLKYQIALVIVGLGLIGWLYTRPKFIVKNSKEVASESQHNVEKKSEDTSDSLHTASIPSEVRPLIELLKKRFSEATGKTEKAMIADSIAAIYKNNKRIDSAAFYKGLIVEFSPTQENLESAGDMFAEAANFSLDQDHLKELNDQARKYYEQALANAPENLDLKSKLAMSYVSSEAPMKGIKMLQEVVNEDPNNEVALFNLGILSIQSNQHDKAVGRFEKLIGLDPENWKARFYLGLSYKELGQNQKASEQLELVKKLNNDPEVISTVNTYLKELK